MDFWPRLVALRKLYCAIKGAVMVKGQIRILRKTCPRFDSHNIIAHIRQYIDPGLSRGNPLPTDVLFIFDSINMFNKYIHIVFQVYELIFVPVRIWGWVGGWVAVRIVKIVRFIGRSLIVINFLHSINRVLKDQFGIWGFQLKKLGIYSIWNWNFRNQMGNWDIGFHCDTKLRFVYQLSKTLYRAPEAGFWNSTTFWIGILGFHPLQNWDFRISGPPLSGPYKLWFVVFMYIWWL